MGAAHTNLVAQGLDEILEKVKAEGWGLYSGVLAVPQESPGPKARGQRGGGI